MHFIIDKYFFKLITNESIDTNKCCEVIAILSSTLIALIFGFTGLIFAERVFDIVTRILFLSIISLFVATILMSLWGIITIPQNKKKWASKSYGIFIITLVVLVGYTFFVSVRF